MANICAFNKIMKLSKLTKAANLLTRSNSSRSPIFQLMQKEYSQFLTVQASQTKLPTHLMNFIKKTRNFATNIDTGGGSSSSSSSKFRNLGEFRAREEQKEEEYEQMQKEEKSKSNEEENRKIKEETARLEILEKSLQYISVHGWTRNSLSAGAEAAGYPGIAHGMFPEGGVELIRYFYNKCNKELVERLKSETRNGELPVNETLEFLICAVKWRLQMIEPYISHWPQALAIMSLPQNVPTSLAQLLTLVDDICYYAGDRSVDFGWYTRRVGLASIFKITELYMLQDSSVEHQATWNFLRKRMEEATQLESFLSHSEGLTQNVQKTLSSAFTTARNILGLGYDRR